MDIFPSNLRALFRIFKFQSHSPAPQWSPMSTQPLSGPSTVNWTSLASRMDQLCSHKVIIIQENISPNPVSLARSPLSRRDRRPQFREWSCRGETVQPAVRPGLRGSQLQAPHWPATGGGPIQGAPDPWHLRKCIDTRPLSQDRNIRTVARDGGQRRGELS